MTTIKHIQLTPLFFDETLLPQATATDELSNDNTSNFEQAYKQAVEGFLNSFSLPEYDFSTDLQTYPNDVREIIKSAVGTYEEYVAAQTNQEDGW